MAATIHGRAIGLVVVLSLLGLLRPAWGGEPADTSLREIVAIVDATTHVNGLSSYVADRLARARLGTAEAMDMYQVLALAHRRLLRNLDAVEAVRQPVLVPGTRDLLALQRERLEALMQAATVEGAQGREAALPWWQGAQEIQERYQAQLLRLQGLTDPTFRSSPGPICRANLNGDGRLLKVLLAPQGGRARLAVLDEQGRPVWEAPPLRRATGGLWFDFNPTVFWRLEVVNRTVEKKEKGETRVVVEGEDILAEAERGAGLKVYRWLRWTGREFVSKDEGYLLEVPPGSTRLTWIRPDAAALPLQPLGLAGRPLAVQDGLFLVYLMHGESYGRFALVTTDPAGFRVLRSLTRDLAD